MEPRMTLDAGLLLVLFCHLSSTMIIINPNHDESDPNNTFTLMMPNALLLDHANSFIVTSQRKLEHLSFNATAPDLQKGHFFVRQYTNAQMNETSGPGGFNYQFKYEVPFEPSVNLNIKCDYCYCPHDEGCPNKTVHICKTTTKYISIQTQQTWILGETDKPMYRPGDLIRFRFISLTNRQLMPSSEPPIWPKLKVHGLQWGNKELVDLTPTELQHRLQPSQFELIELVDPIGVIVKQWRDVPFLQAFNLSHQLIADAPAGEWQIKASILNAQEVLTFNVRHYVLPRFTANVQIPPEIGPLEDNVQVRVCANYSNGPAMPGTIDAQVCLCGASEIERWNKKGLMVEGNQCRSAYGQTKRSCLRKSAILDRVTGCVEMIVNISQLRGNQSIGWGEKLGVFAQVEEEETGSSVVVSDVANLKYWKDPTVKLDFPAAFRVGLPTVGHLRIQDSQKLQNSSRRLEFELTASEQLNPCGGWWRYGSQTGAQNPTLLKRRISLKPDEGSTRIILPPFRVKNPVSIRVRLVSNDDEDDIPKSTSPSPIEQVMVMPDIFRPRSGAQNTLEAFASLSPWEAGANFAIQVTKVVDANITCPGLVTFEVLSNQRLNTNTPITLMYVSRGVLTSRMSTLEQDYSCTPQDDEFGHYTCTGDGEIACHEGWSGNNCQIPQCGEQGCEGNGVCVAPNVCECKEGWRGESCETCVPRTGCVHGKCVVGDDCVCLPGYRGYICNQAEVLVEETEVTEVVDGTQLITVAPVTQTPADIDEEDGDKAPRRTVFRHAATFQVDFTFGPEFRAVAIVYRNSEMASDFIELKDLQMCTSPALADTQVSGIQFQKQFLIPGERFWLSLSVPTAQTTNSLRPDKTAGVCLLRMADIALKNFETDNTRNIDLQAYIQTLNRQFLRFGIYGISSAAAAFRAAGIQYARLAPADEMIQKKIVCPMYANGFTRRMHGSPGRAGVGAAFKQPSQSVQHSLDDVETMMKLRLRDFFPEVWTFDYVHLKNGQYNSTLIVPDSLTSWEANAVCFTADKGLWMPRVKPVLNVAMPFFVEFTPPVKARRGEILHLPISVFVHPLRAGEPRQCYEVAVSVDVDRADWRVVGVTEFETCLCTGDLKETFKLPLKALKMGKLNVTAIAIAKKGSLMCGGDGQHVVVVGDAVRRAVRVVPEGVEKTMTHGGTFCSDGNTRATKQSIPIDFGDKAMVEGSLRSYISVSGNVIGKALSNLDNLVQLPTGCGEQNLVKVAPSVYVLQYLLRTLNQSSSSFDTDNTALGDSKLATKAAGYIARGYENQLKYRHPGSGAFSTFGPKYGAKGNTWLTAYVFEVFSKAERLPLKRLLGQDINAHETLVSAFDFMVSQQSADDGCFEEAGARFAFWMDGQTDTEKRLALTAHVLSALTAATPPLREVRRQAYTATVTKALSCIKNVVYEYKPDVWPTLTLAKVVKALSGLTEEKPSILESLSKELMSRSKSQSSIGGSLKWWPESTDRAFGYYRRAVEVETTAYALLGLTASKALPSEDALAIMRWLSQNQNEQGGFYSTQDTVVAFRALASSAAMFPSPGATTTVHVGTALGQLKASISKDNQLEAHIFPLPPYSPRTVTRMNVSIESDRPVCIIAHFTSFFNIPVPQTKTSSIQLQISTDQGGSKATAQCTTATTTVCLSSAAQNPTGMLLANIQLPSGWVVLANEVKKIPISGALKRVEYDSEKQEVNAYFDGFMGSAGGQRCVTIPMHQRNYVEASQPGLVRAYDYYATDDKVEQNFKLDPCQLFWNPPMGGIIDYTETTTAKPLPLTTPGPAVVCPNCETLPDESVSERLNNSLCNYHDRLYVFLKYANANSTRIPGRIYALYFGTRLASWNTTLILGTECTCGNQILAEEKSGFGFFGRYVYTGDLDVELAGMTIVPLKSLENAAPEFLEKVQIKAGAINKDIEHDGKDPLKHKFRYCPNSVAFSGLLKKLSSLIG